MKRTNQQPKQKKQSQKQRKQQNKQQNKVEIDVESYVNCVMIDPDELHIKTSSQKQDITISIINYSDNEFKISFANNDIELKCNNAIAHVDAITPITSTLLCHSIASEKEAVRVNVSFVSVQEPSLIFNKFFTLNITKGEIISEPMEEDKIERDDSECCIVENPIQNKELNIDISLEFEDAIVIGKEIPLNFKVHNKEKLSIRLGYENTDDSPFTIKTSDRVFTYTTNGTLRNCSILFNRYAEGPFYAHLQIIDDKTNKCVGIKKIEFEAFLLFSQDSSSVVEVTKQKEGKFEDCQIAIMGTTPSKKETEVMFFIANYTSQLLTIKYVKPSMPKGITVKGSLNQKMDSGEESYVIFVVSSNTKEPIVEIPFQFEIESDSIKEVRKVIGNIVFESNQKEEINFPKLNSTKQEEKKQETIGEKKIDDSLKLKKEWKVLEYQTIKKECNWINLKDKLSKEERLGWIILMIKQLQNDTSIDFNPFNIVVNEEEFKIKLIKKNERKLEKSFEEMTSYFLKLDKDEQLVDEDISCKVMFSIGTSLLCGLIGKIPNTPYWLWDDHLENNETPIDLGQFNFESFEIQIAELCIKCWNNSIKLDELITQLDLLTSHFNYNDIAMKIKSISKAFEQEESSRVFIAAEMMEEFKRKHQMIFSEHKNDAKPINKVIPFGQPIQCIQNTNLPNIVTEEIKQLPPFTERDGIKNAYISIRTIMEKQNEFILQTCNATKYNQLSFYLRNKTNVLKVPLFDNIRKLLIMIKVDNSVFGVYITSAFSNNAFALNTTNYKIFSVQNQYETKPFVFTLVKSYSKLQSFHYSHETVIEIPNFISIKRSGYKILIYETLINQHLNCGLHKPSEYLSNNRIPLSSTKKPVEEIVFYEVI